MFWLILDYFFRHFFIIIIYRLRRETAQVDRELEESQRETARLQEVVRIREQEIQLLRERVAAQQARREAARQANSTQNH